MNKSEDYDATIISVDGRWGLLIDMFMTMTVQGRGILHFDKPFLVLLLGHLSDHPPSQGIHRTSVYCDLVSLIVEIRLDPQALESDFQSP